MLSNAIADPSHVAGHGTHETHQTHIRHVANQTIVTNRYGPLHSVAILNRYRIFT